MTPLHVSARPDFDALDVSSDEGPARTEDGRAWVRWAKTGAFSGWYAVGARKPKLVGRPTFWGAVHAVACACAGGNVDQAHCCGRGVLALGGLGVTMRSGYAQLLLHCCLLANPARYVEVMAPVIRETGIYTKKTEKSPSGVALCTHGKYAMNESQMRSLVMMDSDSITWTTSQKKRAKVWVACCSELLRDEAMDVAQHAFAEQVMPAILTDTTKEAIKWPKGPRDAWQYTHEQQMLWALSLVMALEDEHDTATLVCAARDGEPLEDPLAAAAVLRNMQREVQDPHYGDMFRNRFVTAMALLAPLMQVTL
jgi:hypothetical protein